MEFLKKGIKRGKRKRLLAFIFHPVLDILLSKMQFMRPFYSYLRICEEVKAIVWSKAGNAVRQQDWGIHRKCSPGQGQH